MIRSDLWASAFVRRHNDIGNPCVVVRKGDPIAGQIFIEIDHLNGTVTLLVPAPSTAREEGDEDRIFARQLVHAPAKAVRERIDREVKFDPDLWVLALEMRGDDSGARIAKTG